VGEYNRGSRARRGDYGNLGRLGRHRRGLPAHHAPPGFRLYPKIGIQGIDFFQQAAEFHAEPEAAGDQRRAFVKHLDLNLPAPEFQVTNGAALQVFQVGLLVVDRAGGMDVNEAGVQQLFEDGRVPVEHCLETAIFQMFDVFTHAPPDIVQYTMGSGFMKITRILLAECRVPLPHVLKLGTTQIHTRDYVTVRVETDAGISGDGIGYCRGTPLFDSLEMISRRVIGRDPLMRRELIASLENSNVPARAAFTRAVSMLDIACWDILARHAGMPLFRLLGGLRREVPATAVAGYYMDLRPVSDIVDEVKRLLDAGFTRVKIMLKGDDPEFDRGYLAAVTRIAPGRVAADAHWSWSTLTDAWRFCRDLDAFGLDFLEDPFAAADWQLTHELQKRLSTPIAAGEDVQGTRALRDLVSGVGILRVDATTCGGVSGAVEAIHHASGAGRNVFPHVFAPLHVHLACAFANVESVEVITEESGADPLPLLLERLPRFESGRMHAGEDPGAGIVLNWPGIEKLAQRACTV
jgi:L-alanine-DL-glutamate epimerase-like enolase superfamily enzyme